MDKASRGQIKKIWAMATELEMDSDLLHEYIKNYTGKKSMKELTKLEAMDIINKLDDRTNMEGFISEGQLWKIRELERKLGWDKNPERLKGFLKKYYGVESPKRLTSKKAWKAIESLKKMVKRTTQNS